MSSVPPDDERTRIAEHTLAAADDERTRIADHVRSEATIITTPSPPRAGEPTPPPVPRASLGHNAFDVGTKIGEFEILGLVGEGGFGIVYLAYDHSLDRKVALKEYMPSQLAHREDDGKTVVMRSDRHAETFAAGMRSFINEARLLAQFDHYSLVKVYRFWEANGTAYMVMPFYEGITLKQALKDLGAPPDEAWLKTLLAHLLDALEIIHNRQCYHRDIAPDNILIQPDGTPLLLDFGAARRVIGDMTQALTVILKPGYAPIEQYAEVPNMKQGPWTDLYALASVVYTAIVGKAPAPSVARIMSDGLVPLSQSHAGRYSEPFLRAIEWGLTVKPENRPQNIAEFRTALGVPEREPATRYIPSKSPGTPSAAVAPAVAPPPPPPALSPVPAAEPQAPQPVPAARRRSATRKNKAGAIGAAAVAVLIAGGYFAYTASGPAPKPSIDPPIIVPSPTAAVPSSDLLAQVKAKLGGFECARLDAAVDAGAAIVRGHVAAEADLPKLKAEVGSVKGITRVDETAVQIVPPSYCAAVTMLAPFVDRVTPPPLIGLKGGKTTAFEGEKLITEVTAGNFSGFIYADLYDTEGNVIHMLPNSKERKNQAQAGSRTIVGEDGIFGMQWDIFPPFGKHLLVVTAAKSKLFDQNRPDVEPAYKYVSAVQEAMKKQSPQDVAANYQFVDFSPKK